MILLPALVGAGCGAAIVWLMLREGMLAERSGAAMLLAAIAAFYPVFAIAQGDPLAVLIHLLIFVAFVALSIRAYRRGLFLLAGGLIAHGFFDIILGLIAAPGPAWWPAFCAGLDITAGVAMLRLIQQGQVPR